VAGALLLAAGAMIPVDRTVSGPCVVTAGTRWALAEVAAGTYESKAVDHVRDLVLHHRLYRFDRPAFLDLDLSRVGGAGSGTRCEAGDLVARIASSSLAVEIAARETELARARVEATSAREGAKPEEVEHAHLALEHARAALEAERIHRERQRALHARQLIPDDAWDEVEANHRLRELEVRLAESDLAIATTGLSPERVAAAESVVVRLERELLTLREIDSCQGVRTPLAGRLRLGGSPGVLAVVTRPDPMVLEILVPQSCGDRVKAGQPVRARVPGVRPDPEGEVLRVDRLPLSSAAGPFLRVWATVPNGAGALEDRMEGRARIACGRGSVAARVWSEVLAAT